MTAITRRSLLSSAATVIVTFSLSRGAEASVSSVAPDSVDGYLSVGRDGGVTVFAGKVDLGTGARAAIRQIVAEELGLSPERIALVEGDTALRPIKVRPGAVLELWSAGFRSGKRPPPPARAC